MSFVLLAKPGNPVDVVSVSIAFASFVVAFGSFALTLWFRSEARHAKTIQALQGEKEAVAYVAFRVSNGDIPLFRNRREAVFQALCLAAVYERSGRSRVLIYSALKRARTLCYSKEVEKAIGSIEQTFKEFQGVTDLRTAARRLTELRTAVDKKDEKKTGSWWVLNPTEERRRDSDRPAKQNDRCPEPSAGLSAGAKTPQDI